MDKPPQAPLAMTDTQVDQLDEALPSSFAVSAIMERRPSTSPWADYTWNAVGVTVASDNATSEAVKIFDEGDVARFQHFGLKMELHKDECESYYHNLVSPTPRCFVIAEADDEAPPKPFLVSMSFDEAHAYLEGDSEVYAVDIPPELYRWSEAYVLQHYVPEKKTKRKLKNWSESDTPQ